MPSNHLILCHPLILRPSVFPASRFFPMSQFFTSGGQSIGASVSASVLPMNIQDWFPLGWSGLISLQSKGLSRVFSNTTVQKHQFFSAQLYGIPVNLLKTYKANVILCSTTFYLCVNGKVHLKVRVLRRGHLVYFRLRGNILACVLSRFSHVLILCDPMDCSPPGSSVQGILQARTLKWFAMPSSRASSWPRDWTCVS